MIRIALDAMGGDNAPHDVVHGGVEAARAAKGDLEVVMVGDEETIRQQLQRHFHLQDLRISVVHASQTISMEEAPASAVKQKTDASITVAMRLHKEGKVDAVVSAGSTGAIMTSALFTLKRMPGVRRPAITTFLPTEKGRMLLLDVGANVENKPQDLVQFAIMASTYYSHLFDEPHPTVGLLNIGHEAIKGNEMTQQAYALLSTAPVHFIGNVEGGDLLHGVANVVVCDGFVGNVVLKFGESLLSMFTSNLRRISRKYLFSQLGAVMMKPTFDGIRKIFDYQEYGGAPMLGVQGICFKAHGRSTPRAIRNAVLAAKKMADGNINDRIQEEIQAFDCLG
ncbi:MAG TPA: phosphate acyltransferase PlsX [bacterium]|nr:phosphate acyltransferase PlsX [bacterium]HPR86896.1 phosphate acyltransferase PlsX [bacterium]